MPAPCINKFQRGGGGEEGKRVFYLFGELVRVATVRVDVTQ